MKKVLIIANQYPPMGGAGVQRSCKFVKYLHYYSFEPVVFTREMKRGLLDETLFDDLPKHQIYRSKAFDLGSYKGLLGLMGKVLARKILIPDGDYLWSVFAFKKAVKVIEKEKIDIIYSTSFPYSDHLLAGKLKKRFPHIPWVVDFRDEWTKNPYILDMGYPKYRRVIEKKMEVSVTKQCDWFITNTQYMLDNFLEDYPELSTKSTVIPNGYDDDDFTALEMNYEYKDKMTITYTGAMYGRRRPDLVFKAVRNLLDKGLLVQGTLQLQFIGHMDVQKVQQWVTEYNLEGIVTLTSYLPHKESILQLMRADALLLLEGAGVGAKNFSSGKIFEYINCHRPILAVIPKIGAAADIIQETNTGIICDTSSVEDIERGMTQLYRQWQNRAISLEPNKAVIERYHRKELTKTLSSIFEQLCSK